MISVLMSADLSGELAKLKAELIADSDNKATAEAQERASIQTKLDALTTVNGEISTEVQAINNHTTSKTDEVLTAVNANSGVIKSIQRGEAYLPSADMSMVVPITAVNTAKAFVTVSQRHGARYGGNSTYSSGSGAAKVSLTSATELTVENQNGALHATVAWEVVEYV